MIDARETARLENMLCYEKAAYQKGYRLIAGIDEVGRGPLAGPVVAAACILPIGMSIPRVNDSKKLSPALRKTLYTQLTENPAIIYGIGIVEADEIDRINIYQATLQAMQKAIEALPCIPDYLLVDGMQLQHPTIPSLKIIKGDTLSQSIAAASILAKVTRDSIMQKYHQQWPEFYFDTNSGYGTPAHLKALALRGPVDIHRYSFAPLKST